MSDRKMVMAVCAKNMTCLTKFLASFSKFERKNFKIRCVSEILIVIQGLSEIAFFTVQALIIKMRKNAELSKVPRH